jgi:hypothetical protein
MSNLSDARPVVPTDHLSLARANLRSHGIYLGDLPRNRNDPIWSQLTLPPISLTIPQLIVLKNYILRPTTTDFSYGDDEFSNSPVSGLRGCLDNIPDVSLDEALITAKYSVIHALKDTFPHAAEIMRGMIERHRYYIRERLLSSTGQRIREEYALAIRLYTLKETTEDPISLYRLMNRDLNNPSRNTELLANYLLYMKILIKGLRALGKAGGYYISNSAYRYMMLQGNELLQSKYDNYRSCFRAGEYITLAAFTSVSLDRHVASTFGDMLVYELREVVGVRLDSLSMYPMEKELLLIPPCVFRIEECVIDENGLLKVGMVHVRQQGATYLSDNADGEIFVDREAKLSPDATTPNPLVLGIKYSFLETFLQSSQSELSRQSQSCLNVANILRQTYQPPEGLSICEQLLEAGINDAVGKPTWYICYASQDNFVTLVDSIRASLEGFYGNAKAKEVILWIDLFSRSLDSYSNDATVTINIEVLSDVFKCVEHALLIADTWEEPTVIRMPARVLEVALCKRENMNLEVTTGKAQRERLSKIIAQSETLEIWSLLCAPRIAQLWLIAKQLVSYVDTFLPG